MATVRTFPRKEFEITLDDGTLIKGQFGTFALQSLCDRLKCKLYEIRGMFDPKVDGKAVAIEPRIYMQWLLACVEQHAKQLNAPFSFHEVHAGLWIDQLEGTESEEFMKIIIACQDKVKEPQKKTESAAA